jgi:hypothetical protein
MITTHGTTQLLSTVCAVLRLSKRSEVGERHGLAEKKVNENIAPTTGMCNFQGTPAVSNSVDALVESDLSP